jgi:hypothetical protein
MATPNAADKPLLLVALLHDYAARDLVDSDVLSDLAGRFRLAFVSSERLSISLDGLGPIVAQYRTSSWRMRLYWVAAGLWHMAAKRRFELNRRNALRQATFGVGPYAERLIDWGSRVGLARVGGWSLRWLLRATAAPVIPADVRPAAVLAYTSVRSFFVDDLVRDARRRRIPCLALVNNWDNLNTKSFLEVPPHLAVWGEQGFLIARLMYLIPAHRIFVVGSPRFEIYRRSKTTRREARSRLGLPADARVVLFCGAGVSFEEVSLLDELEQAIETGRLPPDVVVVYKPHPLRFKRSAERPFEEASYRHVRRVAAGDRLLTELKFYPDLMSAADAIISPFSSMVIEGARFGLPALCLGYNDPGHANHDWNRAAFNLHSYVVRHGDWGVVCERREDFLSMCDALLEKVGDSAVAESARAAAEMVWRSGQRSVVDRLTDAIEAIVAGRDADNSIAQAAKIMVADSAKDMMALAKD